MISPLLWVLVSLPGYFPLHYLDFAKFPFILGGANPRWRGGFLPTEVLQNMFGFVNHFRHNHRPPRTASGERSTGSSTTRPQNGAAASGETEQTASQTSTSNANTTDDTNQQPQPPQSQPQPQQPNQNGLGIGISGGSGGASERFMEFDVPGFGRTFDPFLPCHSHHIHPILSRGGSIRHYANLRAGTTQASSSQAEQPNQETSQATGQQQPAGDQNQQTSRASQASAQEPNQNGPAEGTARAEFEGTFPVPDHGHIMGILNSILPMFSNVVFRRSNTTGSNTPPTESKLIFRLEFCSKNGPIQIVTFRFIF